MFDIILKICSCLLRAFAVACFITYFNGKKIEFDRRFWLFNLLLSLANSLFYFRSEFSAIFNDLSYEYYYLFVLASYLLNFLVTLLFSNILYPKMSVGKRVLPAFIYLASLFIAINSSICFTMNLDDYSYYYLSELLYIEGTGRIVFEWVDTNVLLVALLAMVLLCSTHKGKGSQKLFYFLLPFPVISILLLFLMCFFSYFNTYELDPFFFFALIASSISSIGIYALIYQIWRKSEIEKEKELYENMLLMESKRYEDMQIASEQIRKIRHDIKNMLYAVKVQMEEEHTEKARRGLEDLLEQVNSAGSLIHSENRMIDYILNAKLASAENKSIRISGDASGMSRMKDIDLSIVLGNVLDNALEATKEINNADIELHFYIKGNYQNILCKNTIDHSVLESNPALNTTKSEKGNHGFGIRSVTETMEKYGGSLEFFEQDHMFCAHIMLPLI